MPRPLALVVVVSVHPLPPAAHEYTSTLPESPRLYIAPTAIVDPLLETATAPNWPKRSLPL